MKSSNPIGKYRIRSGRWKIHLRETKRIRSEKEALLHCHKHQERQTVFAIVDHRGMVPRSITLV
jgi:hypothetical protein